MKFHRCGHIFKPDKLYDWMQTHAANPVAEHIEDSIFRIYFSSRDVLQRSSVGFIEIDLNNPSNILHISEEPVVGPGELGTFDDSGISLGCIVHYKNLRYMYYVGWNLAKTVPFRNSIGLAISEGYGPFNKVQRAPILDRNRYDPFSLSYPWVLKHNMGFQMWYGSNLSWGESSSDMLHIVKYASSIDGMDWKTSNDTAVDLMHEGESAISRPCVIYEDGIYKMWYSFKAPNYSIGYAESTNAKHFTRLDGELIWVGELLRWEEESVCYPSVFHYNGQQYLLYCGSNFGFEGFGLAQIEVG